MCMAWRNYGNRRSATSMHNYSTITATSMVLRRGQHCRIRASSSTIKYQNRVCIRLKCHKRTQECSTCQRMCATLRLTQSLYSQLVRACILIGTNRSYRATRSLHQSSFLNSIINLILFFKGAPHSPTSSTHSKWKITSNFVISIHVLKNVSRDFRQKCNLSAADAHRLAVVVSKSLIDSSKWASAL